jgi:hypothetical protein
MGWLMGFEPTTTGITIQDSTAELQPPLMTFTDEFYHDLIWIMSRAWKSVIPVLRKARTWKAA